MKRVVWLLCGFLGLGCGAAPADGVDSNGGAAAGSGGQGSGGGGAGGSAGGGAGLGGGVGLAGSATSAGAAGQAQGGSATAGSGGLGGTASAGNAGAGSAGGGAGGATSCVPDPTGALSALDQTVHDAKTCLDWMKTTKTGVNYEAAETFCNDAVLGGFDDWRIPSASELASTVTLCGKYPPEGPIDTQFFDQQGDGYWTTTPAGEPNKVCAIGMLNAGGYYHYGTAGPQVVRCVRGAGSVKAVADCTTAQGCSNW